jgi:hypothetical protein
LHHLADDIHDRRRFALGRRPAVELERACFGAGGRRQAGSDQVDCPADAAAILVDQALEDPA